MLSFVWELIGLIIGFLILIFLLMIASIAIFVFVKEIFRLVIDAGLTMVNWIVEKLKNN